MKTNKKRQKAIRMMTDYERSKNLDPYLSMAWQEQKNSKLLKVRNIENK